MTPGLMSVDKHAMLGYSPEQTGEFYEQLLEKLTSLEKFQHLIRSTESIEEAMLIGLGEAERLIPFQVSGIMLVDEKEGAFQMAACEPSEKRPLLQEVIDLEIKGGTFAWALRQTRPVILRSQDQGERLLFCVLTTRSKTLGMFAGIMKGDDMHAAEDSLGLLSLVLLGVTYTLENHTLVQQLREYNEHLQELVSQRSAEIMRTNIELQKEVAERQQREEELRAAKAVVEAADRSKTEFLAMMSHEIRTPMNGVIGFTNLLESSPLNEEQLECVRLLNLSSQQLLCLLNDVLDLSKIEAGELFLDQHPFQIRQLIHDLVDLSDLRARERMVELSFYIDDQVPETIVGDSTRLRQIVMNLLTNALKFTEQGEICLTVECVVNAGISSLLWTVEDTGIGISPDKISLLFQPFKQADSSTTRKFGGTGLGLAICRKLCERMGGDIWVESELGVGSFFRFTLPLSQDPLTEPANPSALANRKVYLVTPYEKQRRLLKRRVRDWGMEPQVRTLDWTEWRAGESDPVIIDAAIFGSPQQMQEAAAKLSGRAGVILVAKRSDRDLLKKFLHGNWSYLTKSIRPEVLFERLLVATGLVPIPIEGVSESHPLSLARKESSALKIILADDNPINLKIALKMLSKLGYEARGVENGFEVLESLKKEHFDLVFLDLEMPGMDGHTVAKSIRDPKSLLFGEQPFIVAMTAHGLEAKERCLEVGMNEFLMKPMRIEDLQKIFEVREKQVEFPFAT